MKEIQNASTVNIIKTTQHVFRLGLVLVIAAIACTGCKHETKAAAPQAAAPVNVAGTYALVSIDGKTVPCALSHDGHEMTINSGSFIINADGTCSSQMFINGSSSPLGRKATYKQDGATLNMQWQGAGRTEGTVTGNTFTMNNEGMIFTYRK